MAVTGSRHPKGGDHVPNATVEKSTVVGRAASVTVVTIPGLRK